MQDILQKKRLRRDPEVQAFEDALCLVFLETQLHDIASRLTTEKTVDVLRLTLPKMSVQGREAAMGIELALEDKTTAGTGGSRERLNLARLRTPKAHIRYIRLWGIGEPRTQPKGIFNVPYRDCNRERPERHRKLLPGHPSPMAPSFLSGQIPLVPETMKLVEGGLEAQLTQVFQNLGERRQGGRRDLGRRGESDDLPHRPF